VSRIFVSIVVTYYRVKPILVNLVITLRLFIHGLGSNNSDYIIELECERCYYAKYLGYLVRTYSNLMLCIYTVLRGGVSTVL
jgi:hypothetical protein